ncbi:MAG: PDZ domain-containing protein [Phycisphaerales bacterium JB052]
MKLQSTLAQHAIVGTLLAATGLPTSAAQAQFRVEYESKGEEARLPAAAPKHDQQGDQRKEQQVIVIQSKDDDHEYEVKIVNGIVNLAKLDGAEIDHDLIKIKGDQIMFLSEDGKVLHELKAPGIAQWSQDKPAQLAWVTRSGDADENESLFIAANTQQPRVMLGINLSEPSDAMRKQLKLGSDQKVILVEKVIDGLPAKKAGLEDFDVILSIDGSDYADGELLSKVMRDKEAGDALKLVVLRGGEKLKLTAKLSKYDAQKLGMANVTVGVPATSNLDFPQINERLPGDFGLDFDLDFGPEIHEKVLKALESSGLSERQIERVQSQLHEHLGGFDRFFQRNDGGLTFSFSTDQEHDEHHNDAHIREMEARAAELHTRIQDQQQEFAALAREKARQAMREAERQVMEMRDGRLIVRNAEQMETELDKLEERLSKMESRLEAQMSRFESQMDRITGMFERLMDRLEEDDD